MILSHTAQTQVNLIQKLRQSQHSFSETVAQPAEGVAQPAGEAAQPAGAVAQPAGGVAELAGAVVGIQRARAHGMAKLQPVAGVEAEAEGDSVTEVVSLLLMLCVPDVVAAV